MDIKFSDQECSLMFTAIHGYLQLKQTTDPSWSYEPNLAPMMNRLSSIVTNISLHKTVHSTFQNVKGILCTLVMSMKIMKNLPTQQKHQIAVLESKLLILCIKLAPSGHDKLLVTEDTLLHRANHFLYY